MNLDLLTGKGEKMENQEKMNELYQVNNTAGWAKEQLRILRDMLDERLLTQKCLLSILSV